MPFLLELGHELTLVSRQSQPFANLVGERLSVPIRSPPPRTERAPRAAAGPPGAHHRAAQRCHGQARKPAQGADQRLSGGLLRHQPRAAL
ncbi:MAG: hypothetical protein ACO231_10295 [Prochlorococcaceae cyanobacterium]